MNKKTIILFAAEIAAVAILRLAYMVRRDKLFVPRASKVNNINRRPVYRQPYTGRRNSRTMENEVRSAEIAGWTPEFVDGKIRNTPDASPDAD